MTAALLGGTAPDPVARARDVRARADATLARGRDRRERADRRCREARQAHLRAIGIMREARRLRFDRLGTVLCMAADPDGLLSLDVTRAQDGRPSLVLASGEIDITSSPSLEACLLPLLDGDGSPVLLDLAEVSFIDASGVRVLVAAHDVAARSGARFALLRPSPIVVRVLGITGLAEVIPLEPPSGAEAASRPS